MARFGELDRMGEAIGNSYADCVDRLLVNIARHFKYLKPGEEPGGAFQWQARKLVELDEPHVIVADSLYSVGNEEETDDAIASILSWPLREPCGFDAGGARCIFTISAGEVRWQ